MRSKTMLEVSRTSIKKADQDLENICFYSLGWPNEKQSTQTRLPKSTCIKKGVGESRIVSTTVLTLQAKNTLICDTIVQQKK